MELLISVYYDVDALTGKPTEYDPSVAVWTTDPEQAQTVSPGRAVDYVPMDAKGHTVRPVSFSNKSNIFPINDLTADLCVALYTKTQSDGSDAEAGKNRPFTIAAGQVNIPWSVIVRFLISNGNAYLTNKPEDEDTTAMRSFPTATVTQTVSSLVVAEGVAYEIQMRKQSKDTSAVTAELKRLGADALSKKGELKILATLVAVSDKAAKLTLRERLDIAEQYYVASAPGFRNRKDKETLDRLRLGHIHASDMVKASQNYDKFTAHEDMIFNAAMKRYRQFYDTLWLATSNVQSGRQLIVFDKTGEKKIMFRPDVPSMSRFHLPLWVDGNDLIPYAEWWLRTLPEHVTHMPKPTVMTEQFLSTLAVMAFKRVDISPQQFTKTLGKLTHRAALIAPDKLKRYLVVGSKQRNKFINGVELVFYACMMVAHAIRYSGDGRYIKVLKSYVRLDVEAPQHDTIAGTVDDADCEDMDTVIAIITSLLLLGREGGDSKTSGRGWDDNVLSMMRRVLQMYCDFNIFGSVRGAQLSDANGGDKKQAKNDDEEGIIGSVEDRQEDIGGHTFFIEKSLPEVADRYEKAAHIVDEIVGFSVSDRIKRFVMGILRGWLGEISTAEASPTSTLLYDIWKSAPTTVLEGTGRQEPLLLSTEHYFGLGAEFLNRVARHASEIDVLERWPRVNTDKQKKSHHKTDNDKMKSKTIKSMGEASPYMFQKRLTIRSMCKGSNLRHLSSFYRRIAHSVSSRLHTIMPDEFVHLVWIDYEHLTYGPTLRSAIEPGGSSIPIPLNIKLHKQYLNEQPGAVGTTNEPAIDTEIRSKGQTFHTDLFSKRMRRIIPYDLSFQHLAVSNNTGAVSSSSALWSDNTKTENSVPLIYSSQTAYHQHDAFFCRSQLEIRDSDNKNADIQSETHLGIPFKPRQPNDALTITVPSESAVASAMRNVYGPSTKTVLLSNVNSCMVTRPENGVIKPIGSEALAFHVNSGAGVNQVRIFSERTFPWLSDNMCAQFTRDVRFTIDDTIKPNATNNIPVTSRAANSINNQDIDEKHEAILSQMRFDIGQNH